MDKEKLKEYLFRFSPVQQFPQVMTLVQEQVFTDFCNFLDQALLAQREEILKSIETLEQVENKVEVFEIIKLIKNYGQ